MKKRILYLLTALLTVCLGLGVLAACGGEKEEPAPVTYTVAFSLGESHAAEGAAAPAPQTEKTVGDTIPLTALQAEEGWQFDGWAAKSGKVEGSSYTVKAADAAEGTITLTAQWTEDEPAPSSDLEGVWSGDVGIPASVTVDVDGSTAHFVIAMNMGGGYYYHYIKFTSVEGVYTCEEGDAEEIGVTIALNEDGDLVYDTGVPGQSMTFGEKEALPAPLNITGTKYTAFYDKLLKIEFGNTVALTYGGAAVAGAEAFSVGEYKVVTCNMTYRYGEEKARDVTFIVFEEQSAYYAFAAAGDEGKLYTLGDEEPTYRVLFAEGDGGSEVKNLPSESRRFKIGEKYTIPAQEPTWENHIFKGWLATIDGWVLENDTLYKAGGRDEYTFTAYDVRFVAQWEANYPPSEFDGISLGLGAPMQVETAPVGTLAASETFLALPALPFTERNLCEAEVIGGRKISEK